jgi:tetratricopeptide (TPR) repeat protein
MDFIVQQEIGFPAPSEKEKIEKAIKRYRFILAQYPNRSDIKEIMFGLADLLVGRGEGGDYKQAQRLYQSIIETSGSAHLTARAKIGLAELYVPSGKGTEIADALALCDSAAKHLGKDVSNFFAAKAVIVEADLRMTRDATGDHDLALKLFEKLVKSKKAHWYFRARAFLGMGELVLYHRPAKLTDGIKSCQEALKLLKDRTGDYFFLKSKVILAELYARRGKKEDFEKAQKLCKEVISSKSAYSDLVNRSKLNLAELLKNPKAAKLYQEVMESEALDPYLINKAKEVEKTLQQKEKSLWSKRR